MTRNSSKFLIIILVFMAIITACSNQFVIDILPKKDTGVDGEDPGKDLGKEPGKETGIVFAVTFESNGGSAVASIKNVKLNSKIDKPDDPKLEYFDFMDWYKEKKLINKWDFNKDTVSSNITLYAKWKINLPKNDGTGEVSDPFLVSDSITLELVGSGKGGWDLDKHYKQTEDIIFSLSELAPIGSETSPFTGIYDGGNHTITDLSIERDDECGLFGYIGKNGVVKNLGLMDIYSPGNNIAGGIAVFNYGMVENCYITGNFTGDNTLSVGGIVAGNYGVVQNCYSNCSFNSLGTYTILGFIVGSNEGIIQNCYSAGGTSDNNVFGIGGIAATNSGIITYCYVTGSIDNAHEAAGIVPHNEGAVGNCIVLSTSIKAGSPDGIGRIVNTNIGSMANNYGRKDIVMEANGMPYAPVNGSPTDGLDIEESEYNKKSFWSGGPLYWENFDNIWEWNTATALPILKNIGGIQNHSVE